MIGSLVLMVLPIVPGLRDQVNGAYLEIHLPGITFQPTEFAKIGLVIFLASYLRDHRQALASGRKILGLPGAAAQAPGAAAAAVGGGDADPGRRCTTSARR